MKIIYNGLTVEEAPPRSKTELGLSENVFVFGMVARGIREKGWEFAISAFNKLENQDVHLVLDNVQNWFLCQEIQNRRVEVLHLLFILKFWRINCQLYRNQAWN